MDKTLVKDVMLPIEEYTVIPEDTTLLEALKALDRSQAVLTPGRQPHRAVLVADNKCNIVGKLGHLGFLKALEPKYPVLGDIGRLAAAGLSADLHMGYANYTKLGAGESIADYYANSSKLGKKIKSLNVSSIVRQASDKIGPMDRKEYITAGVLVCLIILWISASDVLGMGGPVISALVVLNLFGILRWKGIAGIHLEVVALYASACALGKGLVITGAALYLADGFIRMLPDFLSSVEGLAVAASLFTGIATNFMSDGATVSAIGPITVPMATIANTNPWKIGLATAFVSSFAHMLIIGTPNNAIAYAMAKDPITGEQLITLSDFLKHGIVVLILSFAVLWIWTFFGYWRWMGF